MKGLQEYKDAVRHSFDRWYGTQMGVSLSPQEMGHVLNIGLSVLQTRDGGIPGGSFVQAIVNNDLSGAFGRADNINLKAIPFYIILKDHVRV